MRPILTALALVGALTLPAQAESHLTDAEREAFRAEVRAYLIDNPEIIMEAIGVLQDREADAQADADAELLASQMDALTDDGFSYVGGNPEGDVTMVEFLDYRCGYCKRAFPEVEQLLAEDGNIRLIVKEFPILGEESVTASRFAIATKLVEGDGAYKMVHDTLMGINGALDMPTLTRLGNTLGLDTDAIATRMETQEVSDIIAANHALGQALSISGTPTFVIEDQMVRGYVPATDMAKIIEDLRG